MGKGYKMNCSPFCLRFTLLLTVLAASRELVVNTVVCFILIVVVPGFGYRFGNGISRGLFRVELQVDHLRFFIP